jgi:hypothetical protein
LRVLHLSPPRETGRRGRGKGARSSGRNAGSGQSGARGTRGVPRASFEHALGGLRRGRGAVAGGREAVAALGNSGFLDGHVSFETSSPAQASRAGSRRLRRRRRPRGRRRRRPLRLLLEDPGSHRQAVRQLRRHHLLRVRARHGRRRPLHRVPRGGERRPEGDDNTLM